MKFFKCNDCDDLVLQLFLGENPADSCGSNRTEVRVGTVDASLEKHVPVVEFEGNKVKVMQYYLTKQH